VHTGLETGHEDKRSAAPAQWREQKGADGQERLGNGMASGKSEPLKRAFDVALSLAGLIILSPLFLAVAFLVKIQDRGSVIFSQTRIGHGGRRFSLYKFRKFPSGVSSGTNVTVSGDSRMTTFGAFMERTKLDEIPQLWNVLKGDMAFVGWRPESMAYAHLYKGEFEEVLDYKPGILGPWQVKYRTESDLYPLDRDPEEFYVLNLFPAKARMDLEYLRRRTLASDVALLVKGVWATLVGMVKWREFIEQKVSMILIDWLILDLAWLMAFLIRYDKIPRIEMLEVFAIGLLLVPGISIAMLISGGCYKSMSKYYSLADYTRLAKNLFAGMAFSYITLMAVMRTASIVTIVSAAVISVNLMALARVYGGAGGAVKIRRQEGGKRSVLIYGENSLAALLVGWAQIEATGKYEVAGIITGSKGNHGKELKGVPVIGGISQVSNLAAVRRIDELWLTEKPSEHEWELGNKLMDKYNMKVVNLTETSPFGELNDPQN